MFDALIFRPIFNLLAGIYGILPGHDFGIAIIIFTLVLRFLMWPLLKKQLHQSKVMRRIQPEIQELKAKNKDDKRAQSMAMMELYKRHGVNPFSSIGLLLVQLPIFIALFSALRALINDPQVLVERSYPFVENLPHIKAVAQDPAFFDSSFLGLVDMTAHGYGDGGVVWGALVIAVLAGAFQYLQSKQLVTSQDDGKKKSRTMREIMKDSRDGKEPDMAELNALTAKRMSMFIPGLIFVVAAISPAGLALYFATGALVGYAQQSKVLSQDVKEMEEMKITTTVRSSSSATKKSSGARKRSSSRKGRNG